MITRNILIFLLATINFNFVIFTCGFLGYRMSFYTSKLSKLCADEEYGDFACCPEKSNFYDVGCIITGEYYTLIAGLFIFLFFFTICLFNRFNILYILILPLVIILKLPCDRNCQILTQFIFNKLLYFIIPIVSILFILFNPLIFYLCIKISKKLYSLLG